MTSECHIRVHEYDKKTLKPQRTSQCVEKYKPKLQRIVLSVEKIEQKSQRIVKGVEVSVSKCLFFSFWGTSKQ